MTSPLESLSDEELAKRLQQGDEEALALLMQRYEPKLMRYGRRFMATQGTDALSQAVQDVFIAVYQNIEGFDTRQRFSPWIYRIAHNAFVDTLRQRTRQPLYSLDLDTLFPHIIHEDPARTEKEFEEMRVLLESALDKLPSAQREIIVLYYFEELSYREVSDVLRVPVSTVGVKLARARARLKKELPDSSQFPL